MADIKSSPSLTNRKLMEVSRKSEIVPKNSAAVLLTVFFLSACNATFQGSLQAIHNEMKVVSQVAEPQIKTNCEKAANKCVANGIKKPVDCTALATCKSYKDAYVEIFATLHESLGKLSKWYEKAKAQGFFK